MIVIPLIAFELNDWFVPSIRKRAVVTAPCPLFPPFEPNDRGMFLLLIFDSLQAFDLILFKIPIRQKFFCRSVA